MSFGVQWEWVNAGSGWGGTSWDVPSLWLTCCCSRRYTKHVQYEFIQIHRDICTHYIYSFDAVGFNPRARCCCLVPLCSVLSSAALHKAMRVDHGGEAAREIKCQNKSQVSARCSPTGRQPKLENARLCFWWLVCCRLLFSRSLLCLCRWFFLFFFTQMQCKIKAGKCSSCELEHIPKSSPRARNIGVFQHLPLFEVATCFVASVSSAAF